MSNVSAQPLSSLGRSTGRFYLDEDYPIIAMRCYFDGSEGESDSGARWLTLAGYMASDAFWGAFQPKWEKMLQQRYPPAPWLHMYELTSHVDPFERINAWTDQKVSELVFAALDLLQNLDKTAFRAFVCSVDTAARDRLVAEGYNIPDPSAICAQSCFKLAFDWSFKNRPMEAAYVFYDRGEPFFPPIREEWLKRTDPSSKLASGDVWGLIANIQDENMRNTPPIQAADLIAWAYSRELSDRPRDWRYLADTVRKIIPLSSAKMGGEELRKRFA